ncbi:MAG: hypothetical protein OEM96_07020 [Gemmatimonadota bacterium]|nr:hypothetical protein [Gemmatimonadota bacterium]
MMMGQGRLRVFCLLLMLMPLQARVGHGQAREYWTWVVFSSPDFDHAARVRNEQAGTTLAVSVIDGMVDGATTYRVVVGRFPTRRAARQARGLLPSTAPADTWLLRAADAEAPLEADAQGARVEPPPIVEPRPVVATAQADPVASPPTVLQPEAQPPAFLEDAETSAPPSPGGLWHGQVRASNYYYSNIDHNLDDVQSYGFVPSLHLRFQNHATEPIMMIDYAMAQHAYTNTERWDRLSHTGRIEFAPVLSGTVRPSTKAEVSLRGSSEDRDLSDQYRITQEVEFRITRNNRLQAYGAARWKQFTEDEQLSSFKPHIGLRLDNRLSGDRRWEIGARFERNEEVGTDGDYARWTFGTEYRFPALGSRSELEFGLTVRKKDYDGQFVEIEEQDVLRSDRQYIADIVWRRWFGSGLSFELGYEFETRESNDPDKIFNAHELLFSLAFDI